MMASVAADASRRDAHTAETERGLATEFVRAATGLPILSGWIASARAVCDQVTVGPVTRAESAAVRSRCLVAGFTPGVIRILHAGGTARTIHAQQISGELATP